VGLRLGDRRAGAVELAAELGNLLTGAGEGGGELVGAGGGLAERGAGLGEPFPGLLGGGRGPRGVAVGLIGSLTLGLSVDAGVREVPPQLVALAAQGGVLAAGRDELGPGPFQLAARSVDLFGELVTFDSEPVAFSGAGDEIGAELLRTGLELVAGLLGGRGPALGLFQLGEHLFGGVLGGPLRRGGRGGVPFDRAGVGLCGVAGGLGRVDEGAGVAVGRGDLSGRGVGVPGRQDSVAELRGELGHPVLMGGGDGEDLLEQPFDGHPGHRHRTLRPRGPPLVARVAAALPRRPAQLAVLDPPGGVAVVRHTVHGLLAVLRPPPGSAAVGHRVRTARDLACPPLHRGGAHIGCHAPMVPVPLRSVN